MGLPRRVGGAERSLTPVASVRRRPPLRRWVGIGGGGGSSDAQVGGERPCWRRLMERVKRRCLAGG